MKDYQDFLLNPPEMDIEYGLMYLLDVNFKDFYEPFEFVNNDESEWDEVVWTSEAIPKPDWSTVVTNYGSFIGYYNGVDSRIRKYHETVVKPELDAIKARLDALENP